MPGDVECLKACAAACYESFPDGVALWQAKSDCLNTVCD